MKDWRFVGYTYICDLRVAGVLIKNGKILVQRDRHGNEYAIPGGHVKVGEEMTESLIREFKEEIGADICVKELKWVAEVFFPWGSKPCHQICLYYMAEILNPEIPKDGMFMATEHMEGRNFELEYHWVPIEEVEKLEVYPTQTPALLRKLHEGVQHFIYNE